MRELGGGGVSEDRPADEQPEATVMDRLRLMAQSFAGEFAGLSPAEAERLLFDAARNLLSRASVVQFVPILAVRQARRLAQTRGSGDVVIDLTFAPDGEDFSAVPAHVSPPLQPRDPAQEPPPDAAVFYAGEAKRLLERAQQLRAAASASRQSQPD